MFKGYSRSNSRRRRGPTLAATAILTSLFAQAAMPADYYVRPYTTNGYNAGTGANFDNAWNGFNSIDWDALNNNGSRLLVCGVHARFLANNPPNNQLIVGASGVEIDGACDGNPANRGVIIAAHAAISPASWTHYADGVYTTTYGGCTGSFLLESEAGYTVPTEAHPGQRLKWALDQFADPLNAANLPNWLPGTFYQGPKTQSSCGAMYFKSSNSTPANPVQPPRTVYTSAPNVIKVENRSNVSIKNLRVFANHKYAIELINADNVTIANNDLQWGTVNISIFSDSDGGVIRNNTIHDSIGSSIYFITSGSGANAQSHDGWVVEDNEIYNVSTTCEFCGIASILALPSNDPDRKFPDRHGIGIQGGGNGNVFQRNYIHDSGGEGIIYYNWSNLSGGNPQRDNIIRYNYIRDIKDQASQCPSQITCGSGIGIAFSSDSNPADPTTITGNIVHHNLLARTDGAALRTKSSKPSTGFTWRFLNNTIVDARIGFDFFVYLAPPSSPYLGGAEFRNNLVFHSSPGSSTRHLLGSRQGLATDVSGFGMSNNIYYPDGSSMFQWGQGVTQYYVNFADWATSTYSGISETGSSTADPRLANPAMTPASSPGDFDWFAVPPPNAATITGYGDFQLQVTSPAIDAGQGYLLGSPAMAPPDVLGANVAGPINIGAYETQYADLQIAALSASTSGTNVLINDRVTNAGAGAAGGSSVAYDLSTDATYSLDDTSLCNRSIASLASGTSNPTSGTTQSTCAIPSVAAGSYYVLARADSGEAVGETDETNNLASASVSIAGRDLVPTAMSSSRVSGHATKVTIDQTTANQGSLNVGVSTTRYYLSTDQVYDAGVDLALWESSGGTQACSSAPNSIPAGDSHSVSGKYCYKPSGAVDGVQYYVLVRADWNNAITEYNETNNVKASGSTLSW